MVPCCEGSDGWRTAYNHNHGASRVLKSCANGIQMHVACHMCSLSTQQLPLGSYVGPEVRCMFTTANVA